MPLFIYRGQHFPEAYFLGQKALLVWVKEKLRVFVSWCPCMSVCAQEKDSDCLCVSLCVHVCVCVCVGTVSNTACVILSPQSFLLLFFLFFLSLIMSLLPPLLSPSHLSSLSFSFFISSSLSSLLFLFFSVTFLSGAQSVILVFC